MTPSELPAYLTAIREKVAAAGVPVAKEMGAAYRDHVSGFTLRESGSHPPVTRTPAAPGRPPAFMTGELAASVTQGPTEGGPGIGRTSVSPHTIYAATQEFGGVHHGSPYMALWIRYIGYDEVRKRGWLRRTVKIPARPYMRTAVDEMVANGQLSRVAAATFEAVVWG